MKRIGITQRVEIIPNYAERRDCLDQRWADFCFEIGFIPIPLPNVSTEKVSDVLSSLQLDAILLSGGNSISSLTPGAADAAPERDNFERELISQALIRCIPIVGICRGMQMLNNYFGGQLEKIEGHVATEHNIYSLLPDLQLSERVNSYHNWAINRNSLAKNLRPIAADDEGFIEAFDDLEHRVLGLMWHPEREIVFKSRDVNLIKEFFYD